MKIVVTASALVQIVLLSISIGLLWTAVFFYFSGKQKEFQVFGISFLVFYTTFFVLFCQNLYAVWKKREKKE